MSATVPVRFRGRHFWAFDIGLGIFLKHLLDAARRRAEGEDAAWLHSCIQHWRVNRAESGLHLDEDWSENQVRTVLELTAEACTAMGSLKIGPDGSRRSITVSLFGGASAGVCGEAEFVGEVRGHGREAEGKVAHLSAECGPSIH